MQLSRLCAGTGRGVDEAAAGVAGLREWRGVLVF
jgi:hypothetical protein